MEKNYSLDVSGEFEANEVNPARPSHPWLLLIKVFIGSHGEYKCAYIVYSVATVIKQRLLFQQTIGRRYFAYFYSYREAEVLHHFSLAAKKLKANHQCFSETKLGY